MGLYAVTLADFSFVAISIGKPFSNDGSNGEQLGALLLSMLQVQGRSVCLMIALLVDAY